MSCPLMRYASPLGVQVAFLRDPQGPGRNSARRKGCPEDMTRAYLVLSGSTCGMIEVAGEICDFERPGGTSRGKQESQ